MQIKPNKNIKMKMYPSVKEEWIIFIDDDGDKLASAWPLCICRVVEKDQIP
jgi:hypothetical protein